MKETILTIWKIEGKAHQVASVQDDKEKETNLSNLTIQIHDDPNEDLYEQWVEWDFITFHEGIHHSVLEALAHFQHKDTQQWSISNQNGVFGSLINDIGHLFKTIMARPLFKSSHYFSIGFQHTSSIRVTWRILHILLSAVFFHQQHTSTKYLQPYIIHPADTWLTDDHLELLRLMIDHNKMVLPNHIKATPSKTTICLNTFFYPKLKEDQNEALHWLQIILERKDLLTHSGDLLLEELLIPINFENQHWILVTIDVKHGCYFAINPYCPEDPTEFELSIASFITDALLRRFQLKPPQFTHRSPNNIQYLPIQLPNDTINCGVYVSMYMIIYSFGTFNQPYIGNLLIPPTIDECRVLMTAWMLKGEIFFPKHSDRDELHY